MGSEASEGEMIGAQENKLQAHNFRVRNDETRSGNTDTSMADKIFEITKFPRQHSDGSRAHCQQ